MVRQLLAMELTLINVHHPDFNGTDIEHVRVQATAAVQKVRFPRDCEIGAEGEEGEADAELRAAGGGELAVGEGERVRERDKRNKFHQFQRRFVQIQNRILFSLSDFGTIF